MCSSSTNFLERNHDRKENVTISLFRKNFPRRRLGIGGKLKGRLDPTLYRSKDNWGMIEMPTNLCAKPLEPNSLRRVILKHKNCKTSCFHKDAEKQLDVRRTNKSDKKFFSSRKGNSTQPDIAVAAALTISLLCILPMSMAFGGSLGFFPRLPYHKSFVRVPRLQFGSPKIDSEPISFVDHQTIIKQERVKDKNPKPLKIHPINSAFSTSRGLRLKPTPSYSNEKAKQASKDEDSERKNTMMLSDVEEAMAEALQGVNKGSKGLADESMIERFPETTTMSKKSSDPFPAMASPYAPTDAYTASGNEPELLTADKAFSPESPSSFLPAPKKVYNSYSQFNPGQFQENSPEWQMAMLHYLIDMKMNGHKIQEVSVDEPLPTLHRKLTQKGKYTGNLKTSEEGEPEISQEDMEAEKPIDDNAINFSPNQLTKIDGYQHPVICKLEPYNICYRFDDEGNLHPLGARRPVRLIRIYK